MKTELTIEKAHDFYASEHVEYGMSFDHAECVEDVHRIYGFDIAKELNNSIATDIPELGIELM
jgi:hypothetical protein